METRPVFWTLIGAIGLLGACLWSVGVLAPSRGAPSLTAPASMVLVLPAFVFGKWGLAASVLWPLAFLAWARPLLGGSVRYPRRTVILWVLLVPLSLAHFVVGWRFGLEYQGAAFTWGCLALSLVLASGALGLGLACRRRPSFALNLAAHWLLFAWVATYAFPYLGETP